MDFGEFGNFGSIFDSFFHGASPFQQDRPRGVQPRDVEISVEVTLEEVDTGTHRSLSYQVADACKSCEGTGHVRVKGSQLDRCPTCGGQGTLPTNRKIDVKIPKGVADAQKLRVPGGGSRGSNGKNGDLYVVVRERKHAKFARNGSDLETEMDVLYTVAALGGEIKVPTLKGSVAMKIPEGTQSGQKFRLGGQGLPSLRGEAGSLYVKVKILMPKNMDKGRKKLFEELAKLEASA